MKKYLLVTMLLVSMLVAGCGNKKEENKSNNNNKEQKNPIEEIENAKETQFIGLGSSFSYAIRAKVNEGKDLKFFDKNTLYMVPVGNTNTCARLDQETSPIYGKKWNYAYVGVFYEGNGYSYYVIMEDDGIAGIPMTSSNKIENATIYKSYSSVLSENGITKNFSNYLSNMYTKKENTVKDLSSDEKEAFKQIPNIEKVVYIGTNCKY